MSLYMIDEIDVQQEELRILKLYFFLDELENMKEYISTKPYLLKYL